MARAVGPGWRSVEGVGWLARVGPCSELAWRVALGWGQAAMESHRLRLQRAGMLERLALRQGQEALVWATGPGAQAAGLGVAVLRRAPAPTTWEHHLAVGWAAAFFTVRRRALLGGRELLADDRWSAEIGWSEHAGYRQSRHRPDLVVHGAEGRTLAVEVELTVKSRSRTRAVLDMYARSAVIDRVLYLVADELLARHIGRCRERSMLASDRLGVGLLSGLREQTLSTPRQRFSPPPAIPYAVTVTPEELETQKAVERHIAARQREREQEEHEQERRRAAQQQPERSDTLLDADAQLELAALTGAEASQPRRRWRR